ncbi:MAG: conserved phage C-terminal domain-containing protein [Deltaproteobacteria bacterium]|nr:conserved phage C-terminal domain-containing protein [Deltaproteobacteria bacterium]
MSGQRWRNRPEMKEYLNPQTLFRPSHFERYLVEARSAQERKASSSESS